MKKYFRTFLFAMLVGGGTAVTAAVQSPDQFTTFSAAGKLFVVGALLGAASHLSRSPFDDEK